MSIYVASGMTREPALTLLTASRSFSSVSNEALLIRYKSTSWSRAISLGDLQQLFNPALDGEFSVREHDHRGSAAQAGHHLSQTAQSRL